MWVTSSGFETLNLFFIIYTIYLFNKVIATRNIQNTELLFLTLVLVSQCRYESAIFTLAFLFLLPMLLKKEIDCEFLYHHLFNSGFIYPNHLVDQAICRSACRQQSDQTVLPRYRTYTKPLVFQI